MTERPTLHPLYSAGYSGLALDDFIRLVEGADLTVADIRLKPWSRRPEWNRKRLMARLGDRYVWIPELGNLNYKGGPVALQDAAAGLEKLRVLLRERSAVVLCVCADPARCHRTDVTRALEGETEIRLWPSVATADR